VSSITSKDFLYSRLGGDDAIVTDSELETGLIYPPQTGIFNTEVHAERVAEVIFKRNLARVPKPADIGDFIRSRLYKPGYPALI
jgi:malate dehydrogenase (oxaloacetate-decarboxylating)(NADP+)